MGVSLLSFGCAVLLFPVTALRGIGVAMLGLAMNPVCDHHGAGCWARRAWRVGCEQLERRQAVLRGFGEGFMAGIGSANGPLGTMVGYLQSAYNWLSQLLGPLGESDAKWRLGETLGGAAASGINAVVSAIQRVIGFFSTRSRRRWPSAGRLAISWASAVVCPQHPWLRRLPLPARALSAVPCRLAGRTLSASAALSCSCLACQAGLRPTTRCAG